jgi:hypothetical protein
MRSLRRFIRLVALVSTGCRDPVIIDDFGPPPGFAAIQGTIRDNANNPRANMPILVSRCGSPIGGFFGADTSTQQGQYRIEGALHPVLPPSASVDTLRVRCDVFLGPLGSPALTDTVTLRFSASRAAVVPITRDFRLP